MLFATKEEITQQLRGVAGQNNGGVQLENVDKFRGEILDLLVENSVLNPSSEIKGFSRFLIKSAALEMGIIPASIQDLYRARGRGEVSGFTVPALNIRGLSYEFSRAIFRVANRVRCGAFIFEIAKSEIGYTKQPPQELAPVILAAAIKEGFQGPVFIQGDHFQVNAQKYAQDRDTEIEGLKRLIRDALGAGFYNIDIDTSTLVDLSHPTVKEQQRANFEVGVELTDYVRQWEPEGVTVSVGGEIGEVGKQNSTEEELRAYLDHFNELLEKTRPGAPTISKISIQTGTTHGGVPRPDGSVAEVALDFDCLEKLGRIGREQYGLAGAVQHGASTLPADLFHKFPELETAEIHLATDFQNMIYESKHFPQKFQEEIYAHLKTHFAGERKSDWTDEQFLYKTRKKGFGEFKSKFWELPADLQAEIGKELESKVAFLFDQLNVNETRDRVDRFIQPAKVQPALEAEITAAS